MPGARVIPPRLVALSPGDLDAAACAAFAARAARACERGLEGVLLREGRLGDRAYLELARQLAQSAAWLGVHDRPHLARAAGASAVHLGFRSLRPAELRGWLPDDLAIGLSTHAGDDPGAWEGADYLFHGPVFATPSKSGWVEPIGCEGLARGVHAARVPVWALGGIEPQHAALVLATGARGIAVRGSLFGQRDALAALDAWRAALEPLSGSEVGK